MKTNTRIVLRTKNFLREMGAVKIVSKVEPKIRGHKLKVENIKKNLWFKK